MIKSIFIMNCNSKLEPKAASHTRGIRTSKHSVANSERNQIATQVTDTPWQQRSPKLGFHSSQFPRVTQDVQWFGIN